MFTQIKIVLPQPILEGKISKKLNNIYALEQINGKLN